MAYSADTKIPPFKMTDNIYFVGIECASSHIIDTGDGLILIDTGYPEMAKAVKENIESFGFNVSDVKYIIHSHAHIDHAGATKELLSYMKNAKTYIGIGDEDTLAGKNELSWSNEYNYDWNSYKFTADNIMNDGDIIKLGNTEIRCVHTPGHTEGTFSFIFNTGVNGKPYTAAMQGGAGLNTLTKAYLDKYDLKYTMRKKYYDSMEKLKEYKVDIFVGNHTWNNNTGAKAKLLGDDANPFIAPCEWCDYLNKKQTELEALIYRESRELFINYAHRGASHYAPENTMMSFYLGMQMQANGIETDVHKTKDGVLVLIHDGDTVSVSGEEGVVEELTFEELQKYKVVKGELTDRIPSLEDFLQHMRFFDISFAIELKPRGIEKDVIDMLEKYGLRERCVITSIDFENVRLAKLYNPKYRVGLLTYTVDDELLEKMYEANIDELCPHSQACTPELVAKWHRMGFRVRSWATSLENMVYMYECGVDGMTVNFPDKMREYILSKENKA